MNCECRASYVTCGQIYGHYYKFLKNAHLYTNFCLNGSTTGTYFSNYEIFQPPPKHRVQYDRSYTITKLKKLNIASPFISMI